MTIYKKLNDARKDFHSKQLKKSGQNKFQGYSYFELSDFIIPAMEIMDKHGLCGFVSFDKEIASLTIVDVETSEQIVITSPMGSASLKGCHEVQNIGAVETYQRRYLWMAAFEIIEHDALDSSEGVAPKVQKTPLTEGQIADFSLAISESDTEETLKATYKTAYRLAQGQDDAKALNTFTTLYNARKTALGVK